MTLEVVLAEVAQKGLVAQLYDGLNEATRGLVLEKNQQWTGGKAKADAEVIKHLTMTAIQILSNSTSVVTDLTPGAALRLVRYSMMRLRSCLQSLGRFLWHTVSMV